MLRRDEARKHLDAALHDHEVVISAAEALSPTLDDPQPTALAAIDRSEMIEMNDAVRDAVDGAVGGLGGEIVEHDDSGIVLGEVVLERENLAAVAQRALRQQADLRQAGAKL